MRKFDKSLIAGLLATACMTPAMASAQTANNESVESGSSNGEIVVTARKKEETLQDVPLSLQAFSSEELERKNLTDFSDIAGQVPGLELSLERAVDAQIFLRGIGSSLQSAGADNAVGIFLDGVFMSRNSGALLDLYDLERVEVLKGPQSLVYGKNVVGGLINYVTKKPGDIFEGSVEAGYGNYDQFGLAGSVRGPLGENIFGGLSASWRKRDGYATNTLGGDEEDRDVVSLRGQLRFTPTDTLDINISSDYTRHRDGARWVDVIEAGDSEAVTFNRFFAPPIASLPGFVLPNRNSPFVNADPRSGPRNFTGFQNSDMWGITADIEWEASDTITFVSQTAYRDADLSAREDAAGLFWDFPFDPVTETPLIISALNAGLATYLNTVPDDYFDNRKVDNTEQFSQELRILWNNGGPLQLTAGGYFLKEKIFRTEDVHFAFPDFEAITEFAFAMAFGGTPPEIPIGGSRGVSSNLTRANAENLSFFGEFNYKIGETVTLNGGVRYARDQKDFTISRFGQSFDGGSLPPGGFLATASDSWDKWLPSATILFEPSDDVTAYLRYAKGYKAGGWVGTSAGTPAEAIISFRPEIADNFEAGLKMALADRRVRVNMAAYLTEYSDLQTEQFVQLIPTAPPDQVVVNAVNGTRAYGLEMDATAQLTDTFSLAGNYAFSKCSFRGTLIIDSAGTDIDGNTCRRTAKHAFGIAANLEQPVTDNLVLMLGGDFQYSDGYFFDNENRPELAIPSQSVLGARIGIRDADRNWEVTAWAKNLTNELDFVSKFELFGTIYASYTPPRTYGVTAKWRFGN